MKKVLLFLLLCASCLGDASASTLKKVKQANTLNCGISGNLLGFSKHDSNGDMQGLDADYCRAVAAAVGVKNINFVPLSSMQRLLALKNGDIDLLSRTTTWTLSRDRSGLEFIGAG